MTHRLPTVADIYAARRRISRWLAPTPLRHSAWLSASSSARVALKIESIQPSHSFKIRGAINAATALVERGGAIPAIVTASAGNHGRGMAIAAERLGLTLVVFTPATAPETKKAAIRSHGATLDDSPPDYDAAEDAARAYATREGATYISPYNHPDVIAGAGTVALEILEAMPDLDVLVIPLGGGGLAAGMSLAVKAAAPRVQIVGVEAEASTPFAVGVARGGITTIDPQPSIADGLTGNLDPDTVTFELVRRHVDRFVAVSEAALEDAIRGLARDEHLVTEGAGAAATSAVLSRAVIPAGANAAVMVTGANIDLARFASIVAR